MTKILLADDVRLYLALEKTFLARHDYEFLTATRGPDALELLQTERPCLVIAERALPELGAFELRERALEDPELARIPMVVTTANGGPEVAERARELRIESVLVKPFDVTELTRAVERLLPARQRRHPRVAVYLEVGLRTERTVEYFDGAVIDISAGGVLVEVREPLSMGQVVSVQMVLPRDPRLIVSRARVVRYAKEQHRTGRCFGLEFVDLKDEDRARIAHLVESVGVEEAVEEEKG